MDVCHFDRPLGCLARPYLDDLAAQLGDVTGFRSIERELWFDSSRQALLGVLYRRLSRLLLLELHAARITGHLPQGTSEDRWDAFLSLSSRSGFWLGLGKHYPTLLPRARRVIQNCCSSALMAAIRFAADRASLNCICSGDLGDLRALEFGAGDSHRGGQTVLLIHGSRGNVVYKPRSLAVDAELAGFLSKVCQSGDRSSAIRVPRVVLREGYGWAEWVSHRHASDDRELSAFYTGIGHWLAIMRLLGGSDLHAENLIADGPSAVVVDCETLFTPRPRPLTSGLGLAADIANQLVGETVLSVGLLPGRGLALAWRGVDNSVLGSLPGQQPMRRVPEIVGAGTDQARLGIVMVPAPIAQNHPSAQPALARYWPNVLDGFSGMTARLQALDRSGSLGTLLHRFEGCEIRIVPRSTQSYVEVARMLWHPVSLHDEPTAVQRASALLAKMSENVPTAPGDDAVIRAEIDDLLDGDVPMFTTVAGDGRLQGPHGVGWLHPENLVSSSLTRWRKADFKLEQQMIRGSLVSAYINDGWVPENPTLEPRHVKLDDLDRRRRRQARMIMHAILSSAIRGPDGSVAWIAPVLRPTGWTVRPVAADLYGGVSGIALLAAAYAHEQNAGRADVVHGLDELNMGLAWTLRLAQQQLESRFRKGTPMRPPAPGGYTGLGSRIWTWLLLNELGTVTDGIDYAVRVGNFIQQAIEADTFHDLMTGSAGAIVPLLALAHTTGRSRYVDLAVSAGKRLCDAAIVENGFARWPHPNWPDGIGGFAHGATGIGWALSKLHRATQEARFGETAAAAFAFEESLFDADEQSWLDRRNRDERVAQAAWCHGSVGIGLALADRLSDASDESVRSRVRIAEAATWRRGFGSNHTLCHGDVGSWELLRTAKSVGLGLDGADDDQVLARIVSSLEEYGPVWGWAGEAFSPSLMSGVGGIAYQLLRADRRCLLPSVLIQKVPAT